MITIRLHTDGKKGGGVNFEKTYVAFFSGFSPFAFPIFNPEDGDTTQIVHLEEPDPGREKSARVVLIDGENFEYTFSNHSVSGRIDAIKLGQLGKAYDADSGDLVLNNGVVTKAKTWISITGLNIANEAGVRGDVHEVVRGMMGGGHDVTQADPEPLSERLWSEGHRITGTSGNDRYRGTQHDDMVRGKKGGDTLSGGNGDDTIMGQAGKDTLKGGKGADALYGGNGTDRLSGGKSDDMFIFKSVREIRGDEITDFAPGDLVDLSQVDGDSTASGTQRFDYIGGSNFSGTGGEVRSVQRDRDTVLEGDVTGDGKRDFQIILAGVQNFTEGDLLL